MLKSLVRYLTKSRKEPQFQAIPASRYHLNRQQVSRNALSVVERLQHAGYESYLVGGCVRDLLLELHPKDFDVATIATPEQVREVFRNSRIIGRRFRIVHVRFGREVIEVTTFRGHHDSARSADGMLLRDNVFGDIESDALRRDFTINAFYYDPKSERILDYTRGLDDLQNRQLRIIGNPDVRYREDPVRMLRAARFSAKLNFALEAKTASAITDCANLLRQVPSARLFDESLKIFLGGYARACLDTLRNEGLLCYLLPDTQRIIDTDPQSERLVKQALVNTDLRIHKNKRVTPAFIYAACLWPAVVECQARQRGEPPARAHQIAVQKVISKQIAATAIPKRFTQMMREIWELQYRLEHWHARKVDMLLEHPRFRAAYDFLLLRQQSGEALESACQFWTTVQQLPASEREAYILTQRPPTTAKKKPKRRRQRPRQESRS